MLWRYSPPSSRCKDFDIHFMWKECERCILYMYYRNFCSLVVNRHMDTTRKKLHMDITHPWKISS
jgi:hypothetical protein